jgi:hypothetical protein
MSRITLNSSPTGTVADWIGQLDGSNPDLRDEVSRLHAFQAQSTELAGTQMAEVLAWSKIADPYTRYTD